MSAVGTIAKTLARCPPLYASARYVYNRVRPSLRGALRRAVGGRDELFFVQVGSNDGSSGDPLRHLIDDHPRWRGIFVEPVPSIHARLRASYRDDPRFIFEQVAIGREPGEVTFYYVGEAAARSGNGPLPAWYDQLGSFDREHLRSNLPAWVEPFIVAAPVRCLTFADLLARHAAARVDLLHIDAEGADFDILRAAVTGEPKPGVILFEHRHMPPKQWAESTELLEKHDYRAHRFEADCLALRRHQPRHATR